MNLRRFSHQCVGGRDFLGGGRGGEFELFLEAWDLGMVDAFGVVVVFLFGIKLVDFLDVLLEGSGFGIPKTVTDFFYSQYQRSC